MKNFLRRRIDYTTRMHMKRRFLSVDYIFVAAVIGLAVLVVLALRFL